MSVEYGPALGRIRRIIFLYQNVSEIVSAKNRSKRGQKGAILGKNDRLGGISPVDISFEKGGISQNREIVDTPTFPLFGLYMWYLPGKIFFSKDEFYGFSLIHCIICISLYQSRLYVYNIHNVYIFSYYSSPPDI